MKKDRLRLLRLYQSQKRPQICNMVSFSDRLSFNAHCGNQLIMSTTVQHVARSHRIQHNVKARHWSLSAQAERWKFDFISCSQTGSPLFFQNKCHRSFTRIDVSRLVGCFGNYSATYSAFRVEWDCDFFLWLAWRTSFLFWEWFKEHPTKLYAAVRPPFFLFHSLSTVYWVTYSVWKWKSVRKCWGRTVESIGKAKKALWAEFLKWKWRTSWRSQEKIRVSFAVNGWNLRDRCNNSHGPTKK